MLLMAAAVADFRPAEPYAGKLVREQGAGLSLDLEPTDDVIAGLAAERRDGQVLVGFAAEHGGDFVARARGKLERKGIDAIVVNDVSDSSIGFESTDNEVTIVSGPGRRPAPARLQAASSPTRSSIGSPGSAERLRPDRSPVVPTLAAVKDVLILGSTGSIGEQAIDVVGRSAELRIAGLSAGCELGAADRAGRRRRRGHDRARRRRRRDGGPAIRLGGAPCSAGEEGIRDLILRSEPDVVLNAIVGSAGLGPTIVTLSEGIELALANKESLVVGGELVMALVGGRERPDRPGRLRALGPPSADPLGAARASSSGSS